MSFEKARGGCALLRRFAAEQSGSVAIEFVAGFFVLLLVLFGTMSYGEVFFTQLQISNVAGDAARELVVRRHVDDRAELIESSRDRWLSSLLVPSCGTINVVENGTALTVQVIYDFVATGADCRMIPALPIIPLPDQLQVEVAATLAE